MRICILFALIFLFFSFGRVLGPPRLVLSHVSFHHQHARCFLFPRLVRCLVHSKTGISCSNGVGRKVFQSPHSTQQDLTYPSIQPVYAAFCVFYESVFFFSHRFSFSFSLTFFLLLLWSTTSHQLITYLRHLLPTNLFPTTNIFIYS